MNLKVEGWLKWAEEDQRTNFVSLVLLLKQTYALYTYFKMKTFISFF